MVSAVDIIEIIKKIPSDNKKNKFLISLANNWYKFGRLTEKQILAFENAVQELKDGGLL